MLQEVHAPIAHPSRSTSSPNWLAQAPAKISTIMRRGLSVVARIFDGIAEQRNRQAKEIVTFYGQDHCSDWLERKIEDAAFGKRTRL
jgi:hypothetical protein